MDDDILVVLGYLEFTSFLDTDSVLELRATSKQCQKITFPHVNFNTTLCAPFYCGKKKCSKQFLDVAKKSTRLFWHFTSKGNLKTGLFPSLSSLPLTHLTLTGKFNKMVPLKNLPISLTHLTFGPEFNQKIDNLPYGLKYLAILHPSYPYPLENLPRLESLYLRSNCDNLDLDDLPFSLQTLSLPYCSKPIEYLYLFLEKLVLFGWHLPRSREPASIKYTSNRTYFSDPIHTLHGLTTETTNHPNTGSQLVMVLPSTLTHINFTEFKEVDSWYEYLIYKNMYCCKVNNLPSSIRHIKFGDNFDLLVDHLPSSLISLHFGTHFNHPINNLPKTLKKLHINGDFFFPANFLPPSLTNLTLRYKIPYLRHHQFSEILEKGFSFSNTLKVLDFGIIFLEKGGESECLKSEFESEIQQIVDNLPLFLTNLTLTCPVPYFDHLPPKLTHLWLSGCDNIQSCDNFPDSLIILGLINECCVAVDHLPPSLGRLSLWMDVHIDYLPENLVTLDIYENFTKNVDHLPLTMKQFTLTSDYCHPLDNLPANLIYLEFDYTTEEEDTQFNFPLDHLPQNLKDLKLHDNYNMPIDHLPKTLKNLIIGGNFKQSIHHFPNSLRNLTIGKSYAKIVPRLENLIEVTFI